MTRAELLALAARVEAATEGGLALNKAILLALGYSWRGMAYWHSDDKRMWTGPTTFTTSLDAAASLVPEGWAFCVDSNDGGYATVFPRRELGYLPTDPYADAATPALALTAACLRAKAREAGDE
jgi:hypothetical protein